MDVFQAVTVLIGLFALRFAIPLALSLSLGYGLDRLLDRWGANV